MSTPAHLRIVIVAPYSLAADVADPASETEVRRSRWLRIGLLEGGYNIVAVLPADVFLPERLAQIGPDMIIVDAESEARDTLEHVVMATRDARRPIVLFTEDNDTSHVQQAIAAGVTAYVVAALALVGMDHAAQKRPHEISGGMKQRVGIARALAMEPKVLLLDEPFGALDALTRAKLQDELLKIVARTQSTTVMMTHDVDEAVLLSDRIVMMTNGPAATIGEILSVDLARPRDRIELAEDTRYVHYRKEVLDFLYTRHGHVEKQAA